MKCRVLVIEDDVASHRALARMLSRIGYEVSAVTTVRDALARLDTSTATPRTMPQCIILDLMLPDGSGMRVLEYVRSQKLVVKVAVMTGATDPAILDSARRYAPDAMFIKPLHVPELMAWLRTASNGWDEANDTSKVPLRPTG
jgi:DNA-binding response OmpR family regulator